jgi:hypothetical protein
LNVHVNPPVEFVVIVVPLYVPAVHPVGVWTPPLKETFATELVVNPLPATEYVAPTGPWVGVSEIAGPGSSGSVLTSTGERTRPEVEPGSEVATVV